MESQTQKTVFEKMAISPIRKLTLKTRALYPRLEELSGEEISSSDSESSLGLDGLRDDRGLYIDRMLARIPATGKLISDYAEDKDTPETKLLHALPSDSLPEKTEMLEKEVEQRACLTRDLLELESGDRSDELCLEDEAFDWTESQEADASVKDKSEVVKPHLKYIVSFRDFLIQNQYQKAHRVLDKLLHETSLMKYRRDVISSLHRIMERCILGTPTTKSTDDMCEFFHLQKRLSKAMEREEREPKTIEEAFKEKNWPAMKKMYEAQKDMSKSQLNQVLLLAAQKSKWREFWDCVERGADIIQPGSEQGQCSEKDEEDFGPTQTKRRRKDSSAIQPSPLHEALKTGELLLHYIEPAFEKNTQLVSALDNHGNSLLHLAVKYGQPEIRMKNVKFLMKYRANVNAEDATDATVLQYLIHPQFSSWEVDVMVDLVTGTDNVAKSAWSAGDHGWTALHMLCIRGYHQHIVHFVHKGASPRDLRYGLTLIDTLLLQENMPWEQKEKTLAVLLKEPLNLGPFHAQVIKERALSKQKRRYQHFLINGRNYLYPLERLLFPLVSTHAVRTTYKRFFRMLVEGGAACDEELRHVESKLPLMKEAEDVEFMDYLKPVLEELRKRS